jgi:hypothetical protein
MEQPLRCVEAFPVRRTSETVIRRCRGILVPSEEEIDAYVCSRNDQDHVPVVQPETIIDSMRGSPLWHHTVAIYKMLELLTGLKVAAYDSTYPWIEIPFGPKTKAVISTTTGTWNIDFHEDGFPVETQITDIPADNDDIEQIAYVLYEKLRPRIR